MVGIYMTIVVTAFTAIAVGQFIAKVIRHKRGLHVVPDEEYPLWKYEEPTLLAEAIVAGTLCIPFLIALITSSVLSGTVLNPATLTLTIGSLIGSALCGLLFSYVDPIRNRLV